jgi:hypothetical protein
VSIAESVVAWMPLLWFALAATIIGWLFASGLVPGMLRRVKRFGGFGVEFEFSEESARLTRDSVESGLSSVRDTIKRELEAEVRARSIAQGLYAVLQATTLATSPGDYRATIHIPDPLYDDWLYQLIDYYPRGSGHGRPFSARAGLIGRAWRLEEDDEWESSPNQSGLSDRQLVAEWGMTKREAAERRVDQANDLVAIILRDRSESRLVGVLYMDSKVHHRFGADSASRQALVRQLKVEYEVRLAVALTELVEKAMRNSPQLTLERY